MTLRSRQAGAAWLLEAPTAIFTPEQATDEHRLIGQTAARFAESEVLPALDSLERKEWGVARALFRRCGELGFFGIHVPDTYGGVGLDSVSSLIVSDRIARSASFATAFGAQANLAVMPIAMFGSDDQKARYLPGLISGEQVGAYALSEAGSGSDALSIRARAERQPDGSFRLSGEKMWTTNGGFADVMVVFAKIAGEHFSAFIVERAFGGVSSPREERKMGLEGSSTTPLVLDAVPVPAANLLGAEGRGHKVAFTVLNGGRLKLAAMCLGGCRYAIADAARYAGARRQFGQPIASFGAIKHKLGEMTARAYALEAIVYRTGHLIDERAGTEAASEGAALAAALEEFAIEASIAKVAGSETLDFVLDENVQIHGGNGFVRDYPAERYYRDARVNRIFEGTNEINRLLIPGMLARRAAKGDFELMPSVRRLLDELTAPPSATPGSGASPLAGERLAVDAFKKVAILAVGAAMQRFGAAMADEQEVLLWLADLIIDTYAAESAMLRASAAVAAAHRLADLHVAAAATVVSEAALAVEASARRALGALADGDTLRTHLASLRRLLKPSVRPIVPLRRALADAAVARGGYVFD